MSITSSKSGCTPHKRGPTLWASVITCFLRCTSSCGVMSGGTPAGGTIYPLFYVIQSS